MIVSKIINYLKKESFQPNLIGLFLNPFYIIRRGIYRSIYKNKSYIKGILLDFGCGQKPYKNIFVVDKYIGIDIEKSGHEHSESQVDIFYDGKTIPFKDNYFDSIFSSEVFEHIFNLDEVCREINRVLKPNGFLVITIPFVWDEHEIPYDFARYTSFGIIDILSRHGFEIIIKEKTTGYIETIFQMINVYILESIFPKNKYIKILLTPIFIAPLTILGVVLNFILPKNNKLYNNNFIVAKKIKKKN